MRFGGPVRAGCSPGSYWTGGLIANTINAGRSLVFHRHHAIREKISCKPVPSLCPASSLLFPSPPHLAVALTLMSCLRQSISWNTDAAQNGVGEEGEFTRRSSAPSLSLVCFLKLFLSRVNMAHAQDFTTSALLSKAPQASLIKLIACGILRIARLFVFRPFQTQNTCCVN